MTEGISSRAVGSRVECSMGLLREFETSLEDVEGSFEHREAAALALGNELVRRPAGLPRVVHRYVTNLPEVRQQRCTVHLMRNVFSHVPQRHQKRIARELVAVLHADSLVDAKRGLRTFRERFAKQFPEAVACLERGFADATTYFAFPEKHWMRIRSTNGLERATS